MKVKVEVPYRDIDAMGHLNNAVYFSYCEFARQKYWDRVVGLKSILDIGFIMASASIDYRRPAYMGDVLEVEIHCTRMGETSFDFSYRLIRGEEVVAEARSTQVLWDWDRGAKRPFSADLRKKIERCEAEG
ncbi:MAG: acyl-CoA thioesterase [Thermoanaerobaculia bacterium]